jgi:hypothetical protein
MDKRIKISILVIFIVLLATNYNAFYGAYLSTVGSCYSNGQDIVKSKGYTLAGYVEDKIIENKTVPQITILIQNNNTIRHEYCHAVQILQKRNFNCKIKPLFYLNELECYFLENIPIEVK